ncbi:hypothetical protein GCM10009660_27580 [Catellatospora bangladeshensis]
MSITHRTVGTGGAQVVPPRWCPALARRYRVGRGQYRGTTPRVAVDRVAVRRALPAGALPAGVQSAGVRSAGVRSAGVRSAGSYSLGPSFGVTRPDS